jgi:radical SAM superfamily enzyme YgiQ (UPF0313 family)
MRVLLVQPKVDPRIHSLGDLEPLALEILAAAARGHDVRIFDYRYERSLADEIRRWRPEVVGVTAISFEYKTALEAIEEVRAVSRDVRIVVGGMHATMVPEDFNLPGITAVAIGLGHQIFPEVLAAFDRDGDLTGIRGLAFPGGERLHYTEERLPEDSFGNIPNPDRSLTARYRRFYRATFSLDPQGDGVSITSLGCPARCSFCSSWKHNRGRYLERDAESVVEDILSIPERRVLLADDNSLHNVERAWEIVRLLEKSKIRKRIRAYMRADTIARNPDLVKALRRVGFCALIIGYEAVTDERLRGYRKGTTVAINRAAVRAVREAGIENRAMFVVAQDFTRQDFEELIGFIEQERMRTPLFTVFTPMPGTELYEQVKADLLTRDYVYYDYTHSVLPTRLPYLEFYEEFERLYHRASSLRRYLRDWAWEWRQFLGTGAWPATERQNISPPAAVLLRLIFLRLLPRIRRDWEALEAECRRAGRPTQSPAGRGGECSPPRPPAEPANTPSVNAARDAARAPSR